MDRKPVIGSFLAEPDPIRALWLALNVIVFQDSPRLAKVERLAPAARTFYDAECFFGELVNGGLSQFFSNSSGDRSHESLVALDQIGATISAAALRSALQLFPDATAPVDRAKRCELLFRFEERDPQFLDRLTTDFYQHVVWHKIRPFEDFAALQLAFMQQRSAELIAG